MLQILGVPLESGKHDIVRSILAVLGAGAVAPGDMVLSTF